VDDAGPGVPAAVLPHVFERFYRAPRRRDSRSDGGSGIGLAVVKGLAEAMGGSVVARPSPMGGLEVVVSLAVDAELAAAKPVGAERAAAEPAAEPR
jgi:two-component system, OmpR family, sensor histidine kinase BaeS